MISPNEFPLFLGAALLFGLVVAFVIAWALSRPRINLLEKRVEVLTRTLAQTNEMLMQARRQAEAVQKELENARRNSTAPKSPVIVPTGPQPESPIVSGTAFADTLLVQPPPPKPR
jgi:hypothetical protein